MESVILGLLIFQPLTIYDINSAFKEGISLFYSASYGSIQTAIKKLLHKGFITFTEGIENGRNKKTYSITKQGSEHFFCWMKSDIANRKNESIISAKIYFLGLIEDIEDKKTILKDIIGIYEEMQSELSRIQEETSTIEIDDSYKEIFKFKMKSLDYGLVSYAVSLKFYKDLLKDLG